MGRSISRQCPPKPFQDRSPGVSKEAGNARGESARRARRACVGVSLLPGDSQKRRRTRKMRLYELRRSHTDGVFSKVPFATRRTSVYERRSGPASRTGRGSVQRNAVTTVDAARKTSSVSSNDARRTSTSPTWGGFRNRFCEMSRARFRPRSQRSSRSRVEQRSKTSGGIARLPPNGRGRKRTESRMQPGLTTPGDRQRKGLPTPHSVRAALRAPGLPFEQRERLLFLSLSRSLSLSLSPPFRWDSSSAGWEGCVLGLRARLPKSVESGWTRLRQFSLSRDPFLSLQDPMRASETRAHGGGSPRDDAQRLDALELHAKFRSRREARRDLARRVGRRLEPPENRFHRVRTQRVSERESDRERKTETEMSFLPQKGFVATQHRPPF